MHKKTASQENEPNHTIIQEVELEQNRKNHILEEVVFVKSEFQQKRGRKTVINRECNAADTWYFTHI